MRIPSRGVRLTLASLVPLAFACGSPPVAKEAESGEGGAHPSSMGALGEASPPVSAKVEGPASGGPADGAPSSTPDLPGQYELPAWFSEELVEHEAIVQRQRTPAETDGSFKAFILFEMKAGETVESCIEKFQTKLPGELGLAPASAPPGPEGRLQVVGETPAYEVSVMCGEAKGKMSAVLNFNKKPG